MENLLQIFNSLAPNAQTEVKPVWHMFDFWLLYPASLKNALAFFSLLKQFRTLTAPRNSQVEGFYTCGPTTLLIYREFYAK